MGLPLYIGLPLSFCLNLLISIVVYPIFFDLVLVFNVIKDIFVIKKKKVLDF